MEKIILETEKKILEIGGVDYEINAPYGDSIDRLNESLELEENKGREFKIMREFFQELGLKEEALRLLQLPHYKKIIQGLMPKKD